MHKDWISGTIVAGHGVASGRGGDRRFPGGTIRLQQPFFKERGIDLSACFAGTLNVDLTPFLPKPDGSVFDGLIRWHGDIEERFLLSPVEIEVRDKRYSGLWYYPHPETKPEHFQPENVVELLLPWIEGLVIGEAVAVRI